MISINLQIGDATVRIACDRRLARRLRRTYGRFLLSDDAPLGFIVRPPSARNRQFRLLDRCGFDLGSAADRRRMGMMLDSHLTALLPPSDSHARFRLRALITDEGATLCFFPLLFVPTSAVEHLRFAGHEVVDRLAVDIDSRSGAMLHVSDPTGWLDRFQDGERNSGTEALIIRRLVFPGTHQLVGPSQAEAAASLCHEAIAGTREQILNAAIAVAESASITTADVRELDSLAQAVSEP